jgi:hypothetical protein
MWDHKNFVQDIVRSLYQKAVFRSLLGVILQESGIPHLVIAAGAPASPSTGSS